MAAFDVDLALKTLEAHAARSHPDFPFLEHKKGFKALLQALRLDPELTPVYRKLSPFEDDYWTMWLGRYIKGWRQRSSKKKGRPVGTVPDPAVMAILRARLGYSEEELQRAEDDHRMAMAAENLLGGLLEEYLATELLAHGWYCAWGETVKHVDFVKDGGRMLQIKNRSNSENSSSNKVRAGRPIQKWHRINATTGSTEWKRLQELTGCTSLSEEGFQAFIAETLERNPEALYIPPTAPTSSKS
ncbi:MAG: SinI family restriction endonuclease [Bacteroidetes bacterium]|nr:SinI family restriction endonuclease [Bacteroidota bacterium]